MAYTPHSFCWFEIGGDPAINSAFYAAAIGVENVDFPMGDEVYTMFAGENGVNTGGYRAPAPGQPAAWLSYMAVEDVDATAAAVVQHGGAVIQAPFDLPVGRMAVVAEPTGAVFAVFRGHNPDDESDREYTNAGLHWTELFSTDVQATVAFLGSVFGLTTQTMPFPGGTYYVLLSGEKTIGGCMQNVHGGPSFLLNWFQVADCDASVAKVVEHGGKALNEAADYRVSGSG